MTQIIGIGVIGMGWMGTTHSRSYLRVPTYFEDSGIKPRMVICADSVEERSNQAKEMLGFEESTVDWQDVINHPDVAAVNISTPNEQHLEIVKAAAEAGKHIFCEKPVGRTPEETAEIEYAARKAGVMSLVGLNYRWAPLVQYAKQLIEDGKLGELTHYRGRFFSMFASNPYAVLSWRFKEEHAGLGTLGDLMSHVSDMAHMIAGPIKRVVANRETFIKQRPLPTPGEGTHFTVRTDGPMGDVETEDYNAVLVQFANGAHGTLEVCRAIVGPKCEMAFEVNGTSGALGWNFERMNELDLYLRDESDVHDDYVRIMSGPQHPFHSTFNPAPATGLGYDDLKTIEAYQFLRSVVEGKQRAPGFAEILAVAEFQSAVQRSWESGSWEDVVSLRRE